MPRHRIITPEPGYTGPAAGLHFTAGVCEVEVPDDPADPYARAVKWMRTAGYRVEDLPAEPAPQPELADADEPPTPEPPSPPARPARRRR